jgi:hypothetical protein
MGEALAVSLEGITINEVNADDARRLAIGWCAHACTFA